MYVYCVESFVHIECHSACSRRGNYLVDPFATVLLSMSLLCFGIGTMLANLHMCDIMLVLRAVFNMFVRNASTRGSMCFRCLMVNLSGPSELLFSFVLLPIGPEK